MKGKGSRWRGRYDVNATHAVLRLKIRARSEWRDAKRRRREPLDDQRSFWVRGFQNARARARGQVDVRTRANRTRKNDARAHWRSFRHQWMFVLERDRCMCSSRVKEVNHIPRPFHNDVSTSFPFCFSELFWSNELHFTSYLPTNIFIILDYFICYSSSTVWPSIYYYWDYVSEARMNKRSCCDNQVTKYRKQGGNGTQW